MAVHAINLADANNWREASFRSPDGMQQTAFHTPRPSGKPPPQRCRGGASKTQTDMQLALGNALDDRSSLSRRRQSSTGRGSTEVDGGDEVWMREQARRCGDGRHADGDSQLRGARGVGARHLRLRLPAKEDTVHRFRPDGSIRPLLRLLE
jgi:hypothetical protein